MVGGRSKGERLVCLSKWSCEDGEEGTVHEKAGAAVRGNLLSLKAMLLVLTAGVYLGGDLSKKSFRG